MHTPRKKNTGFSARSKEKESFILRMMIYHASIGAFIVGLAMALLQSLDMGFLEESWPSPILIVASFCFGSFLGLLVGLGVGAAAGFILWQDE